MARRPLLRRRSDAIKNLSLDDADFPKKLCAIFGKASPEEIERYIERLNRLKTFTDDKNILANVDKVAFDQEDLADLLNAGADEIYLCDNRFVIPLRMKNKTYIGVGKAVAVIRRKESVDFGELGIKFKNVAFDDDYQKIFDTLQVLTKRIAQSEPKTKNTQTKSKKLKQKLPNTAVKAITTITYVPGFHGRPSSVFVQKASTFKSKIWIEAKGKIIDGKSILMLMASGLTTGTEITIVADGPDAQEAVKTLKDLVDSKFGRN